MYRERQYACLSYELGQSQQTAARKHARVHGFGHRAHMQEAQSAVLSLGSLPHLD